MLSPGEKRPFQSMEKALPNATENGRRIRDPGSAGTPPTWDRHRSRDPRNRVDINNFSMPEYTGCCLDRAIPDARNRPPVRNGSAPCHIAPEARDRCRRGYRRGMIDNSRALRLRRRKPSSIELPMPTSFSSALTSRSWRLECSIAQAENKALSFNIQSHADVPHQDPLPAGRIRTISTHERLTSARAVTLLLC